MYKTAKKLILFIYLCSNIVLALNFELEYKVLLDQSKEPVGFFLTFDVWGDNLYLPDIKWKNIKVYSIKSGELKKIFKKEGLGPGEYLQPQIVSVNEKYLLLSGMLKKILYRRKDFRLVRELRKAASYVILLPNGLIAGKMWHKTGSQIYLLFIMDTNNRIIKRFGKFRELSSKEEGYRRQYPDEFLSHNGRRILFVQEWNGEIMIFDLKGNLKSRFRVRKEALPEYSERLARLMLQPLTKRTLNLFLQHRRKNPDMIGASLDKSNNVHIFYFYYLKKKLWAEVYNYQGRFLGKKEILLFKENKEINIPYAFIKNNRAYTIMYSPEEEVSWLYVFKIKAK